MSKGCIFTDKDGSFTLNNANGKTGLYFPLASEKGLKSAISPTLKGDLKIDQNSFLLEPASIEDLSERRGGRNFWILRAGHTPWSVTGASVWQMAEGKEETVVNAKIMRHGISRISSDGEISASVETFIPWDSTEEIHICTIENTGDRPLTFEFVSAVPIYGRSADNIRDHRHVTSLLTSIYVNQRGVCVKPTLSFDERGHKLNDRIYYVEGFDEFGEAPAFFYPEIADFVGEGGNLEMPMTLLKGETGVNPGYETAGGEAMGAFGFKPCTLEPGESTVYITIAGTAETGDLAKENTLRYKNPSDVERSLSETESYWASKQNISIHTGDENFDGFMKWVSFQPELRRLFGCSFLPHHDYGRGGRGWRDLWQDCLALLLYDPDSVKELLFNNFKGMRADGTNATIIGDRPGEFKADRNGIPRVWMDHGVWPLMTTALYLDETDDLEFLMRETEYYRDGLVHRGRKQDSNWDGETLKLLDKEGRVYEGSLIEHLLLENLTAVLDVGEHNIAALRGADWNDAMDMAPDRGESVAFTHAYVGNLKTLASILKRLKNKGIGEISLLKEIEPLLNISEETESDPSKKREILENFADTVVPTVSGDRIFVDTGKLSKILSDRAETMAAHLRNSEWIDDTYPRFNGYYDNNGRPLERGKNEPHMTLTGQVFAIMSGVATREEIKDITASADALLFDEENGGYRLNTDFKEIKTDMGRMFGFAFGEKENGAVFSHMAVMYGNALLRRGFAKECFKALYTLYRQASDFEKSVIYPGIPEYFGKNGRGLYHYLTGAASWYVYTVVTELFGIKGEEGALAIEPKLLKSIFGKDGKACIRLPFRNRPFEIEFINADHLEYGEYRIKSVKAPEGFAVENLGDKAILKYKDSMAEETVKVSVVLG